MLQDRNAELRALNCTRELDAIGKQLPQYTSMADSNMRFWQTVRPDMHAEDVVSYCLIQYAEKLMANRMYMAKDDNHAQARFSNFITNRLFNLTRKRWRENSDSEIEQKAWTVDAQTFEQTLDLLEQAKGKLKPNDTLRLERILGGENIKDIMPKQTLQMFRRRVRKVYNAL